MSTTTPPPSPDPAVSGPAGTGEPAPFDPHDFPADLIGAQRTAAELYAALHALQKTLPWSREPHPGWDEVTERGRERAGCEASPGWAAADAAAYDKLWEDLREATAAVQTHRWWKTCRDHGVEGAALVEARQKLKRTKGAVPLSREDVDAAA
ncbi:hypothetical protein [Streptomyces longispororuber]|uniref:hypothetical protein n=1 Tax=Streptomyces longispororuber TaxID=68230 RepID=UPI0036F6E3BD